MLIPDALKFMGFGLKVPNFWDINFIWSHELPFQLKTWNYIKAYVPNYRLSIIPQSLTVRVAFCRRAIIMQYALSRCISCSLAICRQRWRRPKHSRSSLYTTRSLSINITLQTSSEQTGPLTCTVSFWALLPRRHVRMGIIWFMHSASKRLQYIHQE